MRCGVGLQYDGSDWRSATGGDNQDPKVHTLASRDHGVGVVWFTNSQHGQAILSSLLAHTVGGEPGRSSRLRRRGSARPSHDALHVRDQGLQELVSTPKVVSVARLLQARRCELLNCVDGRGFSYREAVGRVLHRIVFVALAYGVRLHIACKNLPSDSRSVRD
jgi:hypothetical protein